MVVPTSFTDKPRFPALEYDRFNCYSFYFINCGSSHILGIDL
ncbi:hypothetical protein LEP1GSC104_4835 [Leptospira interrogans str. UI 12621]|uniref:Uncharacterized protein n=1 Tax=Leptospira interrogans str. UI 12621 TaxID=1049937 RepID=A0A0F6HBF0_LEPIR|nr:hypothetical protein LEP1GSC104_4835 [Leptospira interrogans str. UI 12621]